MGQQRKDLVGSASLIVRGRRGILARSLPRLNYQQALRFAISLLLTIMLLYLAFKKVNVDLMLGSLKRVKLPYLLPTICLSFLSSFVRSFLWREIFRAKVSIGALFGAIVIGQMGNNLLPFRAGELLRIYSIAKKEGMSNSLCFSTLVVERMFDFISLAILTAGVSYFVDLPHFLKVGLIVISCGTLAMLGGLFYVANGSWITDFILRWLHQILPRAMAEKFDQNFRHALAGLSSLHSFKSITSILFLSLACWGLMYFSFYFALKAYNLSFPWTLPLFLLVLLNIGMMIPSLPASLGVYQFFSMLALSHFRIEKSVALGFSFMLQAVDFLPSTLLGLLFFQGGLFRNKSIL